MQKRFGTTSDMIIQTVEENGVPYCLAIDEKGLYLTTTDRLDKMLADPNRYTACARRFPRVWRPWDWTRHLWSAPIST